MHTEYCRIKLPFSSAFFVSLPLAVKDVKNKRNPRLVPYTLLDERTKKSNKDSLREAVRTLLGYGYNLEAPDQDHGIHLIFSLFKVAMCSAKYLLM